MANLGKLLVLALLVLTLLSTPVEARALDANLKQLKPGLVTDVKAAACASLGVFCASAKKEVGCLQLGQYCDGDWECCSGLCKDNVLGFYEYCISYELVQ